MFARSLHVCSQIKTADFNLAPLKLTAAVDSTD